MAKIIINIPNTSNVAPISINHNQLGNLQGLGPDYIHLDQEEYDGVLELLEGGGPQFYTGLSPTTVTVQNIPAGTDISDLTLSNLLENIYAPFILPTISTFSIQSQPTTIEVGSTISGVKTFLTSFTNSENIIPNSLSIIDFTNNVTLASTLPVSSSNIVDVGSVSKTTATINQWRGTVTSTQGDTILSPLFTVNWYWRVFAGPAGTTTLTEAGIEALSTQSLRANQFTTFALAPNNYKYICYPDSFGSPTAVTGFKDTATNLSIVMADSTSNAFYNNTQNGWSYGLVPVTNSFGVTTNYRVYRTLNILGSSINILVS